MMKRHGVYALLLLSLIGGSAYSQENQLVTGTIVQRPAQQVVSDDTIPAINLSEEELDNSNSRSKTRLTRRPWPQARIYCVS